MTDTIIVPTSQLAVTIAEYTALGWRWEIVFVGAFYPSKCQHHLWAVQFFKPKPRQPNLFTA